MKLSREARRMRKSYSKGRVPPAVDCGPVVLRFQLPNGMPVRAVPTAEVLAAHPGLASWLPKPMKRQQAPKLPWEPATRRWRP